MCYFIYLSLSGLFLIYSDSVLEQYALSITAGEDTWMVQAIGWEIVPALWPVLVMAMVLASAATFFAMRLLRSKKGLLNS